ncbi:MAG TPA: dienelactone hydrolase family protein [Ktedonobacteraceae bacterium]|nr:dienelactone hydrolase family protein [Ktedonobacteraceae bacterium]
MCFDHDAEPPIELISDNPAHGEDLVLTSSDGAQFAAYAAHTSTPTGAGIVILPDVRGLFHFYKELANRFAEVGVEAVTIDYFGRTAGLAARGEDFDFWPHVMQTRPEIVAADITAALNYLRGQQNAPKSLFTVGFCFGGGHSFRQAANNQGLAGVIGFYGQVAANERMPGPAPIDMVDKFSCPVLGLFGGADQGIPAAVVHQFDAAMKKASVEHEIVIYPGAPHSFFDRKQSEFAKESADSWQRIQAFIAAHAATNS